MIWGRARTDVEVSLTLAIATIETQGQIEGSHATQKPQRNQELLRRNERRRRQDVRKDDLKSIR